MIRFIDMFYLLLIPISNYLHSTDDDNNDVKKHSFIKGMVFLLD